MTAGPALTVSDLAVEIRTEGGWHKAVRDVSFTIGRGETVALVGESGCGKSLTALSIMGLLPAGVGRLSGGEVHLGDLKISGLSDADMEGVRGKDIGMIFQEPMTSLNPVLPIGAQIAEPLIYHSGLTRSQAMARAIELMQEVRIPSAAKRVNDYPHQFSGGMRQRVMIAIALACRPKILIADEPTTALDVTIQAQILGLLKGLQTSAEIGVLLITHNLGVVAAVADRVLVMYGGDVVEVASAADLFGNPTHPYTAALLAAAPRPDRTSTAIVSIPGQVPALAEMPTGCRFQSRCALAQSRCTDRPPLTRAGDREMHRVRCWVKGETP
jgi:peptide/nickel transport system ATP-binding protein